MELEKLEEEDFKFRSFFGDNVKLSKYGGSVQPPTDDALHFHNDDSHSFFAKGRDFESVYVNHMYTPQERETLSTYESLDYFPSHSHAYLNWLKRQPARLDWDRWMMMGFIGFSVGIIGFLLHQLIDIISETRIDKSNDLLKDAGLLTSYGFFLGYAVLFVFISSAFIVLVRPSAGGSGMPELIGFLNGTVVRHIFNVKTLIVKFISCFCAVGSGMPVGPEGPMIHMGSLIGAGLSQFKSETLKFKLPFFERFRNSEDRRNFVSAGAAAGVASAFGAPVGGLLFSMEEVSSFWNQKLSWQIFFCAMVSTFTTDIFNSAFSGFRYQGDFGLFKAEKYILFQVNKGVAVNILAMIPAILLGLIGGILGAMFNFLNLKIVRLRKRILSGIISLNLQKAVRIAEPILIMIITVHISVFLPTLFPCSTFTCAEKIDGDCILKESSPPLRIESSVLEFDCHTNSTNVDSEKTFTYNEVATLLFVTGEKAIHRLYSRNTHLQFGFASLCAILPIYFLLACWSAGTSISSGIVVPMLYIGAVYGRLIGYAMVKMFGVHIENGSYWAWMDPGVFALVGSASFFGGVCRLTMSLTVIMMELTNDIQFLLPIMASIMIAKWTGDYITHPIYHATLELKCIPFLDAEPVILHGEKDIINLEHFPVSTVMIKSPVLINLVDKVSVIANCLLNCNHGGFPVVSKTEDGRKIFFGFINRLELSILLRKENIFEEANTEVLQRNDITAVEYEQLSIDKLENPDLLESVLKKYASDEKYKELFLNLEPYCSQSALTIQEKFSLHRAYIIFRTLGLRHLTIVDERNQVVGILTRKDLMGFNMEEKINEITSKHNAI